MSSDRATVTTQVPPEQKELWVADADRLNMSQSEFVRTMVQAGRRELGLRDAEQVATDASGASATRGRAAGNERGGTASAGAETSGESDGGESTPQAGTENDPVEPGSPGATPGGEPLEDRVLALLSTEDARSWEELVASLTEDLEERLDETLGELQEAGRVRYSGRHGGYVLHE